MNQSKLHDSLIVQGKEPDRVHGYLTKIDLFSFIPVPKDDPVSTKRSIIGSIIFIIVALGYISQDFYFFVTDHPPIIQQSSSKLGFKFYDLPSVAITFMEGQSLNISGDYHEYLDLTMTKELKDKETKLSTFIPLQINNYERLKRWIPEETTKFYKDLYSPAQDMKARGLLYSTENCNYTKITIKRCDFTNSSAGCKTEEQIRKKMAQGRVFLFIQEQQDKSFTQSTQRLFSIANFFLIPKVYKRVTVTFTVVETQVFPDYFTKWKHQNTTHLQLAYITQMTSDVVANAQEAKKQPLEMMGIQFQLAPSVTHVRVTYDNLLDRIGKWGGFCNALFTVSALFLLKYNQRKFYKKHPIWKNYKDYQDKKNSQNFPVLQEI